MFSIPVGFANKENGLDMSTTNEQIKHKHSWSISFTKKEWDLLSGGTQMIEFAYLICSSCGEVRKTKINI